MAAYCYIIFSLFKDAVGVSF